MSRPSAQMKMRAAEISAGASAAFALGVMTVTVTVCALIGGWWQG